MTDQPKLLPCPWCNGEAIFCYYNFITCRECRAEGPIGKSTEEAIKLWNTRVTMGDEVKIKEYKKPLTCMDCNNWMKSKLCPREINVNGWNKGPSSDDIICNKFESKNI